MVWFANEENVESYTNVLGLSAIYMRHLDEAQTRQSMTFVFTTFIVISATIFFPSFITQEFGSLKMWVAVLYVPQYLLVYIFDDKPLQMEKRMEPCAFFIRKFNTVFQLLPFHFFQQIKKNKRLKF